VNETQKTAVEGMRKAAKVWDESHLFQGSVYGIPEQMRNAIRVFLSALDTGEAVGEAVAWMDSHGDVMPDLDRRMRIANGERFPNDWKSDADETKNRFNIPLYQHPPQLYSIKESKMEPILTQIEQMKRLLAEMEESYKPKNPAVEDDVWFGYNELLARIEGTERP
jgi:hypothetical protein